MSICPKCNKEVKDGHFACVHSGKIGGIMTAKKLRALKRNSKKRWEGHSQKKAAEEKDIKENIVSYYKKYFGPIK
ncbi:MAG: hypothetical protein ABFD66_03640 [Smithella sp.]